MPTLKQHLSVLVGGVRAFLDLEVGITRFCSPARRAGARTPERARLDRGRHLPEPQEDELQVSRDGGRGMVRRVGPEKIVWIFGTGRSGNTWLASMMEDLENHAVWREPSVGRLFGEFYYFQSHEGQRGTGNFVLGEKRRDVWLPSIRNFVLEGARGRFPELGDGYLVIKEQVGSVGAPLLTQALPESRMIMLIRDPRDVVASWIDATRKGGWRHGRLSKSRSNQRPAADEDPIGFAAERAEHYIKGVNKAWEAYRSHRGPKVLVKYEDLKADTLGTMKRIYEELRIEVAPNELTRTVEKHAWENVPEVHKGEGKFYRKATPGGWRDDLTDEQKRVVEEITAPILEKFYP